MTNTSRDFVLLTKMQAGDFKAQEELWNKYRDLVSKLKFQLNTTAKSFGMELSSEIEEYDSRAFEEFVKAAHKVDLPRCAHIKNWSIYIHLWGYLKTMNRDIVHRYIKEKSRQEPIKYVYGNRLGEETNITNIDAKYSVTHCLDIPDTIDLENKKEVFWESYNTLLDSANNTQKEIVRLLNLKTRKNIIRDTLNLSQKQYNLEMKSLKDSFQKIIENKSFEKGEKVSYEDIRKSFLSI